MNSPAEPITSGRIMGIDAGDKRIGIALSDETRTIATISFMLAAADLLKTQTGLPHLIPYYDVRMIVLGYPRMLSGKASDQTRAVELLYEELKKQLTIPVMLWDERLTTSEATKTLISGGVSRQKRKLLVDKLAATILLQSFLDHSRR